MANNDLLFVIQRLVPSVSNNRLDLGSELFECHGPNLTLLQAQVSSFDFFELTVQPLNDMPVSSRDSKLHFALEKKKGG